MTRSTRAYIATAAVILAASAGASLAAPQPSPPPAAAPAEAPVTERPETFGRAASTPLEDLNVRKVNIPEPLQRAAMDPYAMDGVGRCPDIVAEVTKLDAALGPDSDAAHPLAKKTTAAGVMRAGVEGVIPYRGWLRQLTGAAKRQQQVQAAVIAGSARRGYLKGMGMRMNCAPPAAPAWFKPAPPPAPVKAARPVRRPAAKR